MSAIVTDEDGELLLETTIDALVERNASRPETCRLLRALAIGESVKVRLVDDSMTVTVERRS